MEKRRRASSSSADDLLSSAPSLFSSKAGKATLKSMVFSLSPSAASALTSALLDAVARTLEDFKSSLRHPNAAASEDEHLGRRPSLSPPSKRSRHRSGGKPPRRPPDAGESETLQHLGNLRAYASVVQLCASHPKKVFAAADLLPSLRLLQDNLVLYEADPALLSLVASICEDWWKEKVHGRESLMSQSLPYLLSRSLTESRKADVKRVYALRDAFQLFDYMDESIDDMRMLLVRCVITPAYLKVDEGRKFIAFALGLSDQLTKEALALIKSQIPLGRKSVLESYAEILFRAWKGSEGSLKEEIEDGFLQGLIEGAIHASSKTLAASARRVLTGFIEQRATHGVEKLLFRLVEPLLFRSLQVTNSNVRQNASYLLLDMFPLEDPEATKEVNESLLCKQFFLLDKLLLDDCPEIRSVAVEGSCRILHHFWEVIPSSTITKFLTKIIDNMSHDLCNEVRLSAINGIIYLIDNPQSHEILRVLLPRFASMFFDPALPVRLAVVELLLAVRDIRTFQFNKVIDIDTLLSSLANDHPRIARKLTKLLIPSYFPSKLPVKEACSRCIALLKRSPAAGARFCEFALSEGSSSKSLLELVKVCISLSLSPKGLTVEQTDGLLIASANICQSVSTELSVKTALSKLLSAEKLKCLLSAAASDRAQTALFSIASNMSVDKLAGLCDKLVTITNTSMGLSGDIEKQEKIKVAHKLIYSCGWFDKMLDDLAYKLKAASCNISAIYGVEVPPDDFPSSRKKKVKLQKKTTANINQTSGKGSPSPSASNVSHDVDVVAAAAWQIKELLAEEQTRNAFLQSSASEIAFSALGVMYQVCMYMCMESEVLDVTAVTAYTTFAQYVGFRNADSAVTEDIGRSKKNGLPQTDTYQDDKLDHVLDHVISCAEKLFLDRPPKNLNRRVKLKHQEETLRSRKSNCRETVEDSLNKTEGGELKSVSPEEHRTRNIITVFAAVLKFIVDSATMKLIDKSHIRCLKLTSEYIQHLMSTFKKHQLLKLQWREEVLKDMLACIKSSFTYAAKLVHLVLANIDESSAPPSEVFYLANDLLNLIVAIESYIGPRYASQIFSVAKTWIPILILGIGCNLLVVSEKGASKLRDLVECNFPMWLTVLGKSGLAESCELQQDEGNPILESDSSVLMNLVATILVRLRKGSKRILEAVGGFFVAGLEAAYRKGDHELFLGLVHFTCRKLLGDGPGHRAEEYQLIFSSLNEIYLTLERDLLEDQDSSGEERRHIESAKSLLRSALYSST